MPSTTRSRRDHQVEPFFRGRPDFKRHNGKALEHYFAALANRNYVAMNAWFIGDSITEGTYGVSSDYKTWVWLLREMWQRAYGSGIGGVGFIPARRTSAPLFYSANPDGKNVWTWTNLYDTVQYGFGYGDHSAFLYQVSGSTGTITVDGDRFHLHYTPVVTTTSNITLTIDGASQTVNLGDAIGNVGGRIWDSGALSPGTHVITIACSTASALFLIDGITVFNGDYTNGIHCYNGGHSGYMAVNFDPTYVADPRGAYSAMMWADIGYQPSQRTRFTDGQTYGTTTLTSSAATFTADDVGEYLIMQSGGKILPGTKIAAFVNSTTVTMDKTAVTGSSLVFELSRAVVTDAVTTTASNQITSATMQFTSEDEGKLIKTADMAAGAYIVKVVNSTTIYCSKTVATGHGSQTLRIYNRTSKRTQPDVIFVAFGNNEIKYAITSPSFKTYIKNLVAHATARSAIDSYAPSVVLLGYWAGGATLSWTDTSTTSANSSPTITNTTGDFGYYDNTGTLVTDLVGKAVTGTNIPGSTTVSSVQTPYSLTLSANCTGNCAGTFTVTSRTYQDFMWARYRKAMEELAYEMTWDFIDAYTVSGYIGTTDPNRLTVGEGLHPCDRGAQLIADYIGQSLGIPATRASKPGQVFLSAQGMAPSITNGAVGPTQIESTTNKVNQFVLDFADGSNLSAQVSVAMPDDWDGGTVTAKFYWQVNNTSTSPVVWQIQGVSVGDGITYDTAFGTAQVVSDAGSGTANTVQITAATPAVTIGGLPSAGKEVTFKVFRDSAHASDTLAQTARLLGVMLTYNRVPGA